MKGKFIVFVVFAVLVQNSFAVSGESKKDIHKSAISTTVESYIAGAEVIFEAIIALQKDPTSLTDDQFEKAQSDTDFYFKRGSDSYLKLHEGLAKLTDSIYACVKKFDANVYGAMKAVSNGRRGIEAYESGLHEAISDFVGIPFEMLLNLDLDNDTRAQIVNYEAEAETLVRNFGNNILAAIRIPRDGNDRTKVTDLWRNASVNVVDFGKLLTTLSKLML